MFRLAGVLEVVQFVHPGGEHGEDVPGGKFWNMGESSPEVHARARALRRRR